MDPDGATVAGDHPVVLVEPAELVRASGGLEDALMVLGVRGISRHRAGAGLALLRRV